MLCVSGSRRGGTEIWAPLINVWSLQTLQRLTSTGGACQVQKSDVITYQRLRWWALVPQIAAILAPVLVIGAVTAMI